MNLKDLKIDFKIIFCLSWKNLKKKSLKYLNKIIRRQIKKAHCLLKLVWRQMKTRKKPKTMKTKLTFGVGNSEIGWEKKMMLINGLFIWEDNGSLG